MIYLMYLFVLVFAWLYCFKAVRVHAHLFFHMFRSVGMATAENEEGFVRVYSIVLKAIGLLFGVVAVLFAITEFTG